MKKLKVRGKINLFTSDKEKFKIFCRSFEKSKQILFMFKRTYDGESIKIRAQHYEKESSFKMTFYNKKKKEHLHTIKDKTGQKIHIVPTEVFKVVGNLVNYKIQLEKKENDSAQYN